ncbi:hypothetical protein V9T40_003075 [Parthenolecanium corni]|uniref:Uncharacterized protein n=1 Tax=Parthenolecanium corni TaxID=536013 RepID=A0AAN9TUC1_9HEMI
MSAYKVTTLRKLAPCARGHGALISATMPGSMWLPTFGHEPHTTYMYETEISVWSAEWTSTSLILAILRCFSLITYENQQLKSPRPGSRNYEHALTPHRFEVKSPIFFDQEAVVDALEGWSYHEGRQKKDRSRKIRAEKENRAV